jgi:hypothetical protein
LPRRTNDQRTGTAVRFDRSRIARIVACGVIFGGFGTPLISLLPGE